MDIIDDLIERDFLNNDMKRLSNKWEYNMSLQDLIRKIGEVAQLLDPDNLDNEYENDFAKLVYSHFMLGERFSGLNLEQKEERLRSTSKDLSILFHFLDEHLAKPKERKGNPGKVDRAGFLESALDAYICAYARAPKTTIGCADIQVFEAILSVVARTVPKDFRSLFLKLRKLRKQYWSTNMPNWHNYFYWTSVDWGKTTWLYNRNEKRFTWL